MKSKVGRDSVSSSNDENTRRSLKFTCTYTQKKVFTNYTKNATKQWHLSAFRSDRSPSTCPLNFLPSRGGLYDLVNKSASFVLTRVDTRAINTHTNKRRKRSRCSVVCGVNGLHSREKKVEIIFLWARDPTAFHLPRTSFATRRFIQFGGGRVFLVVFFSLEISNNQETSFSYSALNFCRRDGYVRERRNSVGKRSGIRIKLEIRSL